MSDGVVAQAGPRRPNLRLFLVLGGLYLAQSVPTYLLAAAIPPILRDQGVSRSTISLFGILLLPMVVKFLWAPTVDRIRPFAWGHRRAWILPTQIGVVAAIGSLALVEPADFWTLFGIAGIVVLLSSTQDIATDGYATRRLRAEERGVGNAIQGGAIAAGVIVGGTCSLVLYEHIGWTGTMLIVAALSALPLVAVLAMEDDDLPPPRAHGPRPSLRAFFARPEARRILVVALIYRASEGLVKAMEGPYLVDAGVPLDVIGYLSGVAAATAGLAGSAIAAVLVRRAGVAGCLVLLGGLRTLCFLLFTLHALGALGGVEPLYGAAAFQTLIRYMEIVALFSLFMAVSSSDQPGTDFTILACAQLVVYMAGSTAAGSIADWLGYDTLFAVSTAISAVAVAATVVLLGKVGRAGA